MDNNLILRDDDIPNVLYFIDTDNIGFNDNQFWNNCVYSFKNHVKIPITGKEIKNYSKSVKNWKRYLKEKQIPFTCNERQCNGYKIFYINISKDYIQTYKRK